MAAGSCRGVRAPSSNYRDRPIIMWVSAGLSHSSKFRIVIETRRNPPRIVRNRCVPDVVFHDYINTKLGLAVAPPFHSLVCLGITAFPALPGLPFLGGGGGVGFSFLGPLLPQGVLDIWDVVTGCARNWAAGFASQYLETGILRTIL